MKRKKEFRKIEWALRKSRGKKKKKINKLFDKMLTIAMSIWTKKFLAKNDKTVATKRDVNSSTSKDEHTKIELTEIPCSGNSAQNYSDDKGYIYTKNNSYQDTLYLVCKNANSKDCGARAIAKNNEFGNVILVKSHDHDPNPRDTDRAKFAKTLEVICQQHPFWKPLSCYVETKKKLKGEIRNKHIHMPSFYNPFIHRKQKLSVPLLPKTIAQFEDMIKLPKNINRFGYDDAGKLFYRGVWRGVSGANVAFVSERTLNEVEKQREVTLLMDGTFKVLPLHLKFRQLYIINVIINRKCYPLAYILMERKDYESYLLVFQQLKMLIPSINVVTCMTDYEAATRKALKREFPTARISGCYFHYVQAVQKACKRFGLKKKEDYEEFKVVINKICALALLPNEFIEEGFEIISLSVKQSQRWDRFKAYWQRQWKKANISVYGLVHRTNNFSESLNRTINLLIGRRPHIWHLIDGLETVEMLKSDELEQVLDGAFIKCKKKEEMIRLNKRIDEAVREFKETQDVDMFLRSVTFDDNLALVYVHDNIEINNTEDFEEEVVPNSFNEYCNFRRSRRRAAKRCKGGNNIDTSKKQRK